jgi:hypothetical protein
VAVRTNLVPNPSFEVDTTDWQAYNAAASISRNASLGDSGSASLSIVTVTAFQPSMAHQSAYMTATAGETYAGRVRIYAPTTSRTCSIVIDWYDSSDALISTSTLESKASTVGSWVTYSGTATAPALTAKAKVRLTFNSNAVGQTHHYDGVMFEHASSVGTYFDGSFTDHPTIDYAWTGTAHASTSTETVGVALGTVTESDSPIAVGRRKQRTVGVNTETGSPVSVTGKKRKTISATAETDAALLIEVSTGIRITTETNTAVALGRQKRKTASLVSETETANSIGIRRSYAVSPATETNEALAFGAVFPLYKFEPPTYQVYTVDQPYVRRPRIHIDQAISVVRIDGTLQQVKGPTSEQLAAAGVEGEDYFIGGHVYNNLPQAVKAELVAAGFNPTPME